MRIACGEAETQLRLSSEASQSLLDRAESLRSERYDNVCLECIFYWPLTDNTGRKSRRANLLSCSFYTVSRSVMKKLKL
jgi:hypothetical protein